MWFRKKFLSKDHLDGFDRYKYSCIDDSWTSIYVMHPLWNYLVEFFPTWLAPNLITFVAFILSVLNYILFAYYDYGFDSSTEIPRWVFLFSGLNVFIYYTLDGIDGKQARRTGTSTPLGELFDHGLDSYNTPFIMIYLFSLFGVANFPPYRMQLMTFNVYLNFYLSHFEKYNTSVMFLPMGYDGTLWGCTIALLLAFVVGVDFYSQPLLFGLSPTNFVEIMMYALPFLLNYPFVLNNIHKAYRDETGKMRTFNEAVKPLYPLVWLFVISNCWAFFSPNRILEFDPRVFFMITGTIFSNFACKLIVAQMADTVYNACNFQLVVYTISVLICIIPYQLVLDWTLPAVVEQWTLYTLVIVFSILHFYYGFAVVSEMCQHFGIKCFTIKPKQQEDQQQENIENLKSIPLGDV